MTTLRLLLPAMLAIGLVPLAAAPASAAPPGNDEPQGAFVLHLGDKVVQNTREATTNAQDDALNANCEAPATNASVWYTYSPAADHKVVLDMTASSYSGGMLVFKGTPTADSLVTCGPGVVGLNARAGKTYYITAISDTDVIGGRLVLKLNKAPTPRVQVSLARRGVAFRGGAARLHGTYFCAHGEEFAELSTRLFQRAGRLKIQAQSDTEIRCNGRRHAWSARLVSPVGTFARGPASAKVTIIACGIFTCRQDRTKRHLHLAWAPRSHRQAAVQPPTTRIERPRPLVQRQGHWPGSRSWVAGR
jgi:hypothetical protein